MALKTSSLIDHKLEVARKAWESLPEVEAAFDHYNDTERVDFVVEFNKEFERLVDLEQYEASGQMNAGQRAQLRELRRLVGENRRIILDLRERSGVYAGG